MVKALIEAKANVQRGERRRAASRRSTSPPASGNVETSRRSSITRRTSTRRNEWGQTPLIFAASQNRIDAVKLLIQRGADAKITSKSSTSASSSARSRGASAAAEDPRSDRAEGAEADRQPGAGGHPGRARAVALGEGAARPEARPPGPRRTDRNFNPEEINPPVAAKGGMTALHHAVRQGYVEATRR